MKYTILLPLVALLLISCNNTAETKSQTKETIKNVLNYKVDIPSVYDKEVLTPNLLFDRHN